MENPSRNALRGAVLFVLGIAIGISAGAIKIEQLRDEEKTGFESYSLANARNLAQAEDERRDLETYYIRELNFYRRAVGVRYIPPSDTDRASGMICAQQFGTPGGAGFGVRSWKPREDGRCYDEDAP
jgi:hypothetical protein